MIYHQSEDQTAVVLNPAATATASVIWLHGLGADGHDFVPLVPELELPATLAVRFVFPHAAVRPVTINQGFAMRAWYDITALTAGAPQDAAGIAHSAARIEDYVRRERAAQVAADRIVIAGFSQGGAMALYTALRYAERLAGVLALSCYLPLHERLASEASAANRQTPILMCHGRQDGVVTPQLGELSRDLLLQLGYPVRWLEYPMRHEVCAAEVRDIAAWLMQILG
jgi:phospholipase/carboxylesterase